MKLTHSLKQITPAIAEKLLETVGTNRKVNQATVDKYAVDMRAGEWLVTGEPIIISETDKLLDGQHRLWAIVASNTTQEMLVIHGVSDNALWAIGTGRPRTLPQVLQMHGYASAHRLAAIARTVSILEYGDKIAKPSVATTLATLSEHPGIDWIMSQAHVSKAGPFCNSGVLAAFALLRERFPAKAQALWDEFFSGTGLVKGDPFLTLRDFLIRGGGRKMGKNGTGNNVAIARRCLTAFVYKMKGEAYPKSYDSETGYKVFFPKQKKAA